MFRARTLFRLISRSTRSMPAARPPPRISPAIAALPLGAPPRTRRQRPRGQREHLRAGQAFAVRPAAPLPCRIPVHAGRQRRAHRRQRAGSPLPVDPGAIDSASFAKCAVAFFRISHPILRRAFSARSRIGSICSGASALPARRVQPPCAGLPSPGCAGPARPTPVPWQLTRWSGRTSLASPPVR